MSTAPASCIRPSDSSSPLECLCCGLIVTDLVCAPLVRIPRPGELLVTPSLTLTIGGCAANVAVNLARLETRVGIAGRIGNDDLGDFASRVLQRAGVETSTLRVESAVQTSATQVVNVQGEDRRFIHAVGANALLDGSEITPEQLQGVKVLYVGGFLLNRNWSGAKLKPLLNSARLAGARTVLDVVLTDAADFWPDLAEVLPETDLFLPNSDEAEQLTGLSDPLEQAIRFREAGAGTVVITRGAEGALLVSDRSTVWSDAFPTQYVDGTGSGDAFAAGYIRGILEGASEQDCLAMGSALGASCVRCAGATTGVFQQQELRQYLASHPFSVRQG